MLSWVTDGGLETDLLFHRGIDLPEFAAFPLVEDERAQVLRAYYADYVAVAIAAMFICTLSTIYPARLASSLSPVDGLRHE